MTRKTKKVEFHFDEPDDDPNCPICGNPLILHEEIQLGHGAVHLPCTLDANHYAPTPARIAAQSIDRLRGEVERLEAEVERLRDALAKSDPIGRIYDEGVPVLVCIHCGGERGRLENEVSHTPDCIWVLAKRGENGR